MTERTHKDTAAKAEPTKRTPQPEQTPLPVAPSVENILMLQRLIGNQAVGRMLVSDLTSNILVRQPSRDAEVAPSKSLQTLTDPSSVSVSYSGIYKDILARNEKRAALLDFRVRLATVQRGEELSGGVAPSQEEIESLQMEIDQLDSRIRMSLTELGMDSEEQLRSVMEAKPKKEFASFIDNAAKYGMPVKFLRTVLANYHIKIINSGDDNVQPTLDTMSLSRDTMDTVENFSPLLPFGESAGIQTIFHESTHAYFDLESKDPNTAKIIETGQQHYKDAPLKMGKVADDPNRVFQEAAASYVGHRVVSWWQIFEMLSMAASGEIPSDAIAEWVEDAKKQYNEKMSRQIFGYQETGGFFGFGTSQTETTRALPDSLRIFLDTRLLEGKIPNEFEQVSGFQELVRQATQPAEAFQ
jgi:hypothetical protein